METQVIRKISYDKDVDEKEAIARLVGHLGDEDPNVRWGAAIDLQRKGKVVAGPLTRVLAEGSDMARPAAIWALGKINDPGSEKPLIEALSSNHAWTRWMAMASLTMTGSPEAMVAVERALRTEDGSVRGILAELVEGS